jgi:hypothetical protein
LRLNDVAGDVETNFAVGNSGEYFTFIRDWVKKKISCVLMKARRWSFWTPGSEARPCGICWQAPSSAAHATPPI